ncbi:zf-HC2 domain-containing protein [Schinkia azotoformans]|uniref:zf-HC2 domain-containing protein n=1 Tax=Schinkia azotoformans TaxID=1454 RepID=UPI002DBD6B55|nr:zf-HC2 domain-containing protein [Schinkia azotoformans]MEC1718430.1 zf-HC2 domain-containing protein [Schinkia azotoformans]MEC1743032.1 zf-HC2 domain-containing protein [Schinkia azotoformans]MEC1744069.1 zf-HC2 domain-containing protein [Schinkia azotoformans]MEC1765483.1 zf-HC2 domain-containing protein [Schinkia azotoformans]MEC1772329.1 zf-HC2 domain-containing protein [Schinkia azotoformans]
MNCNIIKDLLPSYIDGICSDETIKLVEDHIKNCKECKVWLNRMQKETKPIQLMPEDVEKAVTPFKKINRKRRIQVFIAIMMTFMMTIVGYYIVQDVGAVNQLFFPKKMGFVNMTNDKEEWESVKFNDQDFIIFDSIFWDKEIINDDSNELDIFLRVKDEKGNILIDEIQVPAGQGVKLDDLKRNKKYFFEIKAPQGRFSINAT